MDASPSSAKRASDEVQRGGGVGRKRTRSRRGVPSIRGVSMAALERSAVAQQKSCAAVAGSGQVLQCGTTVCVCVCVCVWWWWWWWCVSACVCVCGGGGGGGGLLASVILPTSSAARAMGLTAGLLGPFAAAAATDASITISSRTGAVARTRGAGAWVAIFGWCQVRRSGPCFVCGVWYWLARARAGQRRQS